MVREIDEEVTRQAANVVGAASFLTHLQLGEAKRRYEAHFVSKLTDSDGENAETDTWLDFARDSGYLNQDDYECLRDKCHSVGRMLGSMLRDPGKFLLRTGE